MNVTLEPDHPFVDEQIIATNQKECEQAKYLHSVRVYGTALAMY